MIHVCILHLRPRQIAGQTFDPLLARKHREHHADPWRADLVFIPPRAVIAAAPAVAALWLVPGYLTRAWLPALTGLAVYMVLALHYEWVHLLVHTRYRPRTWLYKHLWRHHRLHHFKNEHYWFGVSMTSGDALLGTRPDHGDVETSGTCRTLGIDPDALRRGA